METATVRKMAISILLAFLAPIAAAGGTIFDYTGEGRSTRMWVPDDLDTVRGLLIYGNPAGGDARHYVENLALRGFAIQYGFVVIGTAGFGYLQNDEIEIWERHLVALASMSGYGEIVYAPWAPLGFSNGGQMSYGFNARRPGKVIGFVANKGGYYNDSHPPEEALATPGILVAGELDSDYRRTVIRMLFEENRARGALWTWVEEQEMGHEGDDERLFLPFLAEALQLRYPSDQVPTDTSGVTLVDLMEEDGWLVDTASWSDPLTRIASYDQYEGDPATAGWVPSEGVAYLYRAFATRTDWITHGGGGSILDRPLYIEIPGWDDYWTRPAGEAPDVLTVRIDTREYPFWTAVAFYSNARLLALVEGDGSGVDSVGVDLILDGGVHGLSALVTDLDGTVRTTGLRHRVVIGEVLSPSDVVPSDRGMSSILRIAGSNPTNGPVHLLCRIKNDAVVDLSVFDVAGRRIDRLYAGEMRPGDHAIRWDAGGHRSGIYFIRMQVGSGTRTVRFSLLP